MTLSLRMNRLLTWVVCLGVLSIACTIFFHRIGAASLMGDESTFAEVSREAAESGRWWPLTYFGQPFIEKPPMTMWATAAVYRGFGVSETTTRIVAALFGVATVFMVSLAGCVIFGPGAGFWAGLLLLSTHYFVFMHGVRSGVTDSPLVFLVSCALLLHLRYRASPTPAGRWSAAVATGILTGLALLTKNAVGWFVVFALAVFEANCALRGRRPPSSGKRLALIAWIALTFQLGWFFALSRTTGGGAWAFFRRDIWERFTVGVDPGHINPGLYGFILWFDFGKGSILLLAAALIAWRDRCAGREDSFEKVFFLAVWVVSVFLIMEPSVSKLSWYIYPAYPGLALLLGFAADRLVFHTRGLFRLASALLFLVMGVFVGKHVRRAFVTADREVAQTDANVLATYLSKSPRLTLCRDPGLSAIPEWDLFYLGAIPREAPPSAKVGTSPCELILTRKPELYLDASRFPARIHPFRRYGEREEPLFVVNLRNDFPPRLFD